MPVRYPREVGVGVSLAVVVVDGAAVVAVAIVVIMERYEKRQNEEGWKDHLATRKCTLLL